jgi:hypothetical protein
VAWYPLSPSSSRHSEPPAAKDPGSSEARTGLGVLEQLVIGPYALSGFLGMFDGAPA